MGSENVSYVKRSKAKSRNRSGLDEFLCHTMKQRILCFECPIERTVGQSLCPIPFSGDQFLELIHSRMEHLPWQGLAQFCSTGP